MLKCHFTSPLTPITTTTIVVRARVFLFSKARTERALNEDEPHVRTRLARANFSPAELIHVCQCPIILSYLPFPSATSSRSITEIYPIASDVDLISAVRIETQQEYVARHDFYYYPSSSHSPPQIHEILKFIRPYPIRQGESHAVKYFYSFRTSTRKGREKKQKRQEGESFAP